MKRVLYLLLALVLWLPAPLRAQDAEALAALVGVLKEVDDPQRFGVAELDGERIAGIVEKPSQPKSNLAVTGCYFYDGRVFDIVDSLSRSDRGELEITSVNQAYLYQNRLHIKLMGRGFAWLDTGTQEAMNNASNFIKTIEDRQGLKVACLEEIAIGQGFIDRSGLEQLASNYTNEYGDYLKGLLD